MRDEEYYFNSPYMVAHLKHEPEMHIHRHDINLDYGFSLIIKEHKPSLNASETAEIAAVAAAAAIEIIDGYMQEDCRDNGRRRRGRR